MKAFFTSLIYLSLLITINSQIIRVPSEHPTIQAGIDAASDGDTVLVAPGEYFENLEIAKSILLTSNFMNAEDTSFISNTVINGSLIETSVIHVYGDMSVHPIIQGFTITEGKGIEAVMDIFVGGGIFTTTNVTIQFNKIVNNTISSADGICLGGGICTLIEPDKNGLEILIQFNNIANNSLEGFLDAGGGGIGIYAYTEVSSGDVRILNNIITNNQISTVKLVDGLSGGGGIQLSPGFPVLVSKNIISNNKGIFGGGILLGHSWGARAKIINNTIVGNEATQKGGGLCIRHGRADIANSIFWNNVAPVDSCISARGDLNINYSLTSREYAGTNNITENPLLTEDFLLLNNSPAIDAGNPEASFNDIEDSNNPGTPLWPSKGSQINDIGATGGNYEMVLPDSEYTLPKRFLYGDYNGIVYRIAKPLNYDSKNYYPMTVVLHQQYVHGTDNEKHLYQGLLWRSNAEAYKLNEFTLVPQNRVGPRWNVDELNEVIHHIIDIYPIDTTRIYMTGVSEGGLGVSTFISKYPNIIAAGIPISESRWSEGMKHVPFWIFHGSEDGTVPVQDSRNTISSFEETGLEAFRTEKNSVASLDSVLTNGGRLLYTEYQGAGHDINRYVFENEKIYEWVAKQRKPQIQPNETWTDKLHYGFPNEVGTVRMNFINKNEYNANYTGHISSLDKSTNLDFELFDDGAHNDSDPNDGIWGNIFSGLNSEDFYRVSAEINNTDLSSDFYFQDLSRFTTAGPIKVIGFEHQVENVGDTIQRVTLNNIELKNEGQQKEISLIRLNISSENENVVSVFGSSISFGSLGPQESRMRPNAIGFFTKNMSDSLQITVDISSSAYVYWKQDLNIIITDIEETEELPSEFSLSQNYPNPFNPTTRIQYYIPVAVPSASTSLSINSVEGPLVTLKIFDLLGREISILVNEKQKPGNYEVNWDAVNVPSGIYFYRLRAGDYIKTKKMLLIK